MTEMDKKVILALAECDMCVSRTGRKLYMHHNSIMYHVRRIREITGLDPKKFYDLQRLVEEVKNDKHGDT